VLGDSRNASQALESMRYAALFLNAEGYTHPTQEFGFIKSTILNHVQTATSRHFLKMLGIRDSQFRNHFTNQIGLLYLEFFSEEISGRLAKFTFQGSKLGRDQAKLQFSRTLLCKFYEHNSLGCEKCLNIIVRIELLG
jgi:hypothetical protein